MILEKEEEYIIKIMEIYIMENGKKVNKKEKEFIIGMLNNGKVIDMKEDGKKMKEMVMEFIIILRPLQAESPMSSLLTETVSCWKESIQYTISILSDLLRSICFH